MKYSLLTKTIALLCSFDCWGSAFAEDAAKIAYREQVTKFFAGQAIELHLNETAAEASVARLRWSLRIAHADQVRRNLASQEVDLKLAPNKSHSVDDRPSSRVLVTDREVAITVDLTEQIAGKKALQDAAFNLVERVIPKLVSSEKTK